ncbi:potassium voltage-gated channel protein Shal-like [Uloborus diversus]|uniref:potassium voltage-gated channel protein Shal-like n=1 Tax=Uloborus diversus TaxID=327109 RepID=UPI00240A1676|nr:potassium voltage-gated channel protein Shal-like [Uloborus diversus]
MARIRIAKATTGAAFVSKKKAVEARIAARESGQEVEDFPDDIFELQHHHLLRCLEKTTDREFVEHEVPYNGQPNRPASTPPITPLPSFSSAENIILQSCCGRRCSKKSYRHRGAAASDHEEELNDVQVRLQNRTSPDGGHYHRPSLGNNAAAVATTVSSSGSATVVTLPHPDSDRNPGGDGSNSGGPAGVGTVRISTL